MTPTDTELKTLVRQKYSEIALQPHDHNAASCCGATVATTAQADPVYKIMAEDYSTQPGYTPEADLGLGCGLPVQHAALLPGMTVLDLGSGAGNDAFVARSLVGPQGKVIGVDFTPAMLDKARANADKLGYVNVEFREGELEALPVGGGTIDAIISNCVLNLVPNKAGVFTEMHRVLRPGGHFCVSDIVLQGTLPPALQQAAEMYAGCVSGAIPEGEYLALAAAAGFNDVQVVKRREIVVPDDILLNYLSPHELAAFRASPSGIYSVTVVGHKAGQRRNLPATEGASTPANNACCGPDCC